jgi:beta-glucosidase
MMIPARHRSRGARRTAVTLACSVLAGADVAQVYVGDPAATGEPAEQLKGFQRVTLAPGQTRLVRFTLDRRAFAWWNEKTGGWTVTPGRYALMVGDSSASLSLTTHVEVS